MRVRHVSGAAKVVWALVAVATAGVVAAQGLPIENIQLRGDRFPGLHYRDMNPEQRALLYNVVNSARAVTNTTGNGPFNTLLRSPGVGELSQQLGNTIRFSSGLSGRLRELATLMAGCILLIAGWLRAGNLVRYVPEAVIAMQACARIGAGSANSTTIAPAG